MRYLRRLGLGLCVTALATMGSVTHAEHKGKPHGKPGGGGDGGGDTTNLMEVEFTNRPVVPPDPNTGDPGDPGDQVTDDGFAEPRPYRDSRAGGDVQADLYPSGNLRLSMAGTDRRLNLNFGREGDGADRPFEDVDQVVKVRPLHNSQLQLQTQIELDCPPGGGKADLNCRGLLCIMPGASARSGASISWAGDEVEFPNRAFKIRWFDQTFNFPPSEMILITRCSDDGSTHPLCLGRGGEDGASGINAWIFSTTDSELDTGPLTRLTSDTIRGKSDPQDHGLFDMSFEFVATCVKNCPLNCTVE